VKKARLHAVEELQERIAREINATYLNRVEEVLVESHQVAGGQHQWRGRTRTNKLVFFPAQRPSAGENGAETQRQVMNGPAGGVAVVVRPQTDVRPGDLVSVQIAHTTAWSLQGTQALR